jgi:diguanylate cyclase (GGDEF)-like protein/PAS domain S-box-containing protein
MTELVLDPPAAAAPPAPARGSVHDAILEGRQRWRHLVSLAADIAFETDSTGRFVLMVPDAILGWPAGSLIGQPSECLAGDDGAGAIRNPFHPTEEIRKYHAWLRCADGKLAMMAISAAPIHDAAGQVIGARGIGVDVTGHEAQCSDVAARLRRGQVLHHILSRVKRETDVDSMMDTALGALIHALGAEGAAAIGAVSKDAPVELLHECGAGAPEVLEVASSLVASLGYEPGVATNHDGRLVLAVGCETRSGLPAGLAIWRPAHTRTWDQEDTMLAGSTVCIVRMVLEFEALRQELAQQARTDPLTGLLNRRAFIEEMRRQIARLDRESGAGTLMFVDLDAFKSVNDRLGHGIGDQVLVALAGILRRLVRPFDLITRLGGDEFAVWLGGADHMTAAERADHLCKTAPLELQAMLPEEFPKLGVSVGIATRRAGSHESIEDLTRRADMAMYEVKRSGRRHWRVSLLDGDS